MLVDLARVLLIQILLLSMQLLVLFQGLLVVDIASISTDLVGALAQWIHCRTVQIAWRILLCVLRSFKTNLNVCSIVFTVLQVKLLVIEFGHLEL